MPVGGVDDHVVARAQPAQESYVPERSRPLVESNDVQIRQPLRYPGMTGRKEEIDARLRQRALQRPDQGNGEQGVPDPVIGAHHQHAPDLLEQRHCRRDRQEPAREPGDHPHRDPGRRIEARVHQESTSWQASATRSAPSSRKQR